MNILRLRNSDFRRHLADTKEIEQKTIEQGTWKVAENEGERYSNQSLCLGSE
jgi:hypothetical protein